MRMFFVDPLQFESSIMNASLPVLPGSFVPNFTSAATLERNAGELMYSWFPHRKFKNSSSYYQVKLLLTMQSLIQDKSFMPEIHMLH